MRRIGREWLIIALALALAGCLSAPDRPAPERQSRAPIDLIEGRFSDVPQPTPAWEARSAAANAREVATTSYVVQPGDTLSQIAQRTGAGLQAIARLNGLDSPDMIRAGQRLSIPAGRYHEVARGETGIAIARAYGVQWSEVVALNGLEEPYLLRAGERILLPSAAEARAMSRAERARAFSIDIDDIITGGEPALARNEAPAPPAASPARTLASDAAVRAPASFTGRFGWPLEGPVLARFGPGGSGLRNNGIDIGVAPGTPVLAAADGVIVYAGEGIAVNGGLVLINHGDGWITAYGHTERIGVTRGQRVTRGQQIARTADQGIGDAPTLHFEMRRNREPVDPLGELPPMS